MAVALGSARARTPAALVDLDRYPVLDLDGAGAPMVERARRRARATPACRSCPGFLRADALPGLVAECDALAAGAYLQDVQGTPYLELPDADAWPAGHPRVTWDSLGGAHRRLRPLLDPATSALRALFEWDVPARPSSSRILGRSPLYRYADPARRHEPGGDARRRRARVALRPDRLRRVARHPVERRRRRVRERAAPALGRRRRHRRALRRRRARCSPATRRSSVDHGADDARHAHALRGPLVAAPGHAGRRRRRPATWRCSATTRSPAR